MQSGTEWRGEGQAASQSEEGSQFGVLYPLISVRWGQLHAVIPKHISLL